MIHHWLKESRDVLRNSLSNDEITTRDRNILVMPDGQPAATAGEMFIAVYSGGVVSVEQLGGPAYKESYSVVCTVTQRVRHSPEDRDGDKIFLAATRALSKTAAEVSSLLSNSDSLLQTVITAVQAENASAGALEPLFYAGTSPPMPRYKDWFYSVDPSDGDRQPAGYSMDVTLTGGTVIFKVGC